MRMKKLGMAVTGALGSLILWATPALAQSNLPPPDVGGEVVAPPGAGADPAGTGLGGLSFTGTGIAVWMVAAAVLLVLGVGFLLLGRRRARHART